MSESLAYVGIVKLMLFQEIMLLVKSKGVRQVIDNIERDFIEMDQATDGERKIFFKNQILIWKLVLVWVFVSISIVGAYMLKTILELLYQALIQEYFVGRLRPFVFPLWLPYDDVNDTPIYEILLFVEYVAMVSILIVFHGYLNVLIQFIVHMVGQFDIIILNFQDLFKFDGAEMTHSEMRKILKHRMRAIIRRHQRILDMRIKIMDVFGVALFTQMLLSSIVLCMTGFQVAVGVENGQIKILFVMLFGGAVVQLLIPSIIGSMFTEKAKLAGDACYSCNWERFDIHNTIEKDLQIFLIRSSRPLEISALGLTIISMETFSGIMSTAASYFTMIRQMNNSV
ncbi:odorant receptor 13a-like [Arctopsyche grandis]|uniref:odorant receptor 13a-like n=1 Tax=Arctopsyche grandis TaxID=121162 RepID=UPI00406D94F7